VNAVVLTSRHPTPFCGGSARVPANGEASTSATQQASVPSDAPLMAMRNTVLRLGGRSVEFSVATMRVAGYAVVWSDSRIWKL
jgi:hypothetical protein